jgi:hypothetical protein
MTTIAALCPLLLSLSFSLSLSFMLSPSKSTVKCKFQRIRICLQIKSRLFCALSPMNQKSLSSSLSRFRLAPFSRPLLFTPHESCGRLSHLFAFITIIFESAVGLRTSCPSNVCLLSKCCRRFSCDRPLQQDELQQEVFAQPCYIRTDPWISF